MGPHRALSSTAGPAAFLVVDEPKITYSLYLVGDDGNAWFTGNLRELAAERFDAAGPGGTFRYRNRSLQRLADAEVVRLVEDGLTCVGITI